MTIEQTISYRGVEFTVTQRTTSQGSWYFVVNPLWCSDEGNDAYYRSYEEAVNTEKSLIDAILGPKIYRRRCGEIVALTN